MQSLPTLVHITYRRCVLLPHHTKDMIWSGGRYPKQQVRVVLRSYLISKVPQAGNWVLVVFASSVLSYIIVVEELLML